MMMMKLHYRREHSASDFGTNWKFICDFLLAINTNLHLILTVSKLWLIISQIFASDRGVSHFNAPTNIAMKP